MLTLLISCCLLGSALASDCSSLINFWNKGWGDSDQGDITLPFPNGAQGWKCEITFDKSVSKIDAWDGTFESCSGSKCEFVNQAWNWIQGSGDTTKVSFQLWYSGSKPNVLNIKINGQDVCGSGTDGSSSSGSTDSGTSGGTSSGSADLNVVDGSDNVGAGGCVNEKYAYGTVIEKSLLFYEAQRSGKLPADQRVTWRKDSGLNDGQDNGKDLTGGYYDAGDFVKFNFPMASAMTLLSWGGIAYEDGYTNAGQLEHLKEAVKWGNDYFIKCHTGPNEYYAQVGNGEIDHAAWCRPEDMTMARPSYKVNCQNPGSDVSAETAASLASAAILMASDDAAYSQELLSHAVELFDFAENCKGKYSDAIYDASIFYNSWSGYNDELAWGAAWLYKATGDQAYLTKAKSYAGNLGDPSEFSWDNKAAGAFAMLAELTGDATYKNKLKAFCDDTIDNKPRSPKGQVFIMKWGSNRYAANAALICLRAADLGIESEKYTGFAAQQLNYMLGDSGRSFVVGFGTNPPTHPHHAASNCEPAPAPCGWDQYKSSSPNYYTLEGALCGGPSAPDDQFPDNRQDYITAEVTLDYNAGFQSVLAGLNARLC